VRGSRASAPERGQHVRAAERASRLAARDDTERPRLVVRREHLALDASSCQIVSPPTTATFVAVSRSGTSGPSASVQLASPAATAA
jgi:ribosomal protein L18